MKSALVVLLSAIGVAFGTAVVGGVELVDLSDRSVLSVSLHGRMEAETVVLKL